MSGHIFLHEPKIIKISFVEWRADLFTDQVWTKAKLRSESLGNDKAVIKPGGGDMHSISSNLTTEKYSWVQTLRRHIVPSCLMLFGRGVVFPGGWWTRPNCERRSASFRGISCSNRTSTFAEKKRIICFLLVRQTETFLCFHLLLSYYGAQLQ